MTRYALITAAFEIKKKFSLYLRSSGARDFEIKTLKKCAEKVEGKIRCV